MTSEAGPSRFLSRPRSETPPEFGNGARQASARPHREDVGGREGLREERHLPGCRVPPRASISFTVLVGVAFVVGA